MCSITGVGERLHKVLGQFGLKLWFPWQPKAPIDLQWGKCCPEDSASFFIGSSSKLQVTTTAIKSQTSSILGHYSFRSYSPLSDKKFPIDL